MFARDVKIQVAFQNSRCVVPLRDDMRRRALARLYERRSAVDNLIHALERYQKEQREMPAARGPFSAAEMSS